MLPTTTRVNIPPTNPNLNILKNEKGIDQHKYHNFAILTIDIDAASSDTISVGGENMERLYDITDVCRELNVTSRTLRHWEERGIIASTKTSFKKRRQYSEKQIDTIKKVVFLRSIGIPITDILEWQKTGVDIKAFIEERRGRLLSLIERKMHEYERLTDVYMSLCNGKDIFSLSDNCIIPEGEQLRIAKECTDAFLSGELYICASYFSEKMKNYMPISVFEKIREDTLRPLGEYLEKYTVEADNKNVNVVYARLYYEKLGLCIKYVFSQNILHGLWFNYFGDKENRMEEIL